MRLTPLDIKKQDFERTFRGFDADEVRAFLDMVATQWGEMQDEHRRLQDRVRELAGKLDHYQKVEEALQEALQTARESSEQRLANAQQKAEMILEEARTDSREVLQGAEAQRNRLIQQTQQLVSRRDELIARLRAFLSSEMELLTRFDEEKSAAVEQVLASIQQEQGGTRAPRQAERSSGEGAMLGVAAASSAQQAAPEAVAPDEAPPRRTEPDPGRRPIPDEEAYAVAYEDEADADDPEAYDDEAWEPDEAFDQPEAVEETYKVEEEPEASGDEPPRQVGWNVHSVFDAPRGPEEHEEDVAAPEEEPWARASEPAAEEADEEEDDEFDSSDELEKIRRILRDLE